jgi:hypothetical protein
MKTVTIKQTTLDTLLWAAGFAADKLEESAEWLRNNPANKKDRRALRDRARRWRRAMETADQARSNK